MAQYPDRVLIRQCLVMYYVEGKCGVFFRYYALNHMYVHTNAIYSAVIDVIGSMITTTNNNAVPNRIHTKSCNNDKKIC